MGTCDVVVEQQAVGTVVWMACTPSLEDLGQANVDVPLGITRLPILERGGGHVADFGEDCDCLFESASQFLEFHRWALTSEKPV